VDTGSREENASKQNAQKKKADGHDAVGFSLRLPARRPVPSQFPDLMLRVDG